MLDVDTPGLRHVISVGHKLS